MSESTDIRTNVLNNYICGDYIFSSNFDSGNLGRVELLENFAVPSLYLDTDIFENITIHAEFNAWTTPDCFGTPNESPNRTWFFFSIRGGNPSQNVKINIKNLNRQSKLFGHGMSPVMKIGKHGKWERIRHKPTYQNEEENFMIGFIHRVNDKPDVETFYAFTYPFTYTECQNMLLKFDQRYGKSAHEKSIIINRLLSDKDEKPLTRKVNKIDIVTSTSSEDTSGNEGVYDRMSINSLQNEIYYHRELLINSLENRRVDLLTITSYQGIQHQREDVLKHLFPDNSRCHCFKDKKIIFLSSRVHPGETPASFVLNGFLNLILDKKSSIGNTLRKIYVFKIIPILNPDGVYRGFYRTDTLGQNLNRMYIDTKLVLHPSIYAVKKLIKFYHFGIDTPDESEVLSSILESSTKTEPEEKSVNDDPNKIDSDREITPEEVYSEPLCPSKTNISSESDEVYLPTYDPCSKKVFNYIKKHKEPKLRKGTVKSSHSSLIRNFEQKLKESGSIQQRHMTNKKNFRSHCGTSKMYLTSQKLLNKRSFSNSTVSSNESDLNCKLFLYIDMHGHASKKGVFMYGNHFPYTTDAVDCMLLPRLMTINCQHFHFDACNFSERNMYRREKRDGLSKEGSGRVAVYKMTGLVKSYTLECNYNCGKYVNVLPTRGNNYGNKTVNCNPPKYTPAIFEEVGRSLGSSILDITNSNSISRIQNSDFRSLQGLRIALRNEIERNGNSYRPSTSSGAHKVTSNTHPKTNHTKKRNVLSTTQSVLPTYEIAKENKFYTIPWKTRGSSLSQQVPQANLSLKLSRNIKKTAFKTRPINIYSKKDATNLSKKKPKILVETCNATRKESSVSFSAVPNKKVKISLRNTIKVSDALTNPKTFELSTPNSDNLELPSQIPPHVLQFEMIPGKNIKTIEKNVSDQQLTLNKNNLLRTTSATMPFCPTMNLCLKKSISDSEICNIAHSKQLHPNSYGSTSQRAFHTGPSSLPNRKTLAYNKSEIDDNYSKAISIDTTFNLSGRNQKIIHSNLDLDDSKPNNLFKQKRNVLNDCVIFKRKNKKNQISRY